MSVSLYFKKPIHAVTLTLFLELLAEVLGSDLIRLKGFVYIKEASETPTVPNLQTVTRFVYATAWRFGNIHSLSQPGRVRTVPCQGGRQNVS